MDSIIIKRHIQVNYADFLSSLIFALFTLIGYHFDQSSKELQLFERNNIYIAVFIFSLFAYYTVLWGLKKISRSLFSIIGRIPSHILMVILGCKWGAFLILCYPGSVPYDGFYMLGEFFNIFPRSNNHPFFSTVCQGLVMAWGRTIVNDNWGIFLFLLLHTALMFFCVVLTIRFMEKWNISKPYINIVTLLFLINPVLTMFTQYYRKDVVFGCLLYLYSLFFSDSIVDKSKRESRTIAREDILIFLFGFIACLYRHNGVYIVLMSLTLKLIYIKKLKITFLIFFIFTSCFIVNNVLYPAIGVEKVSEERTYSYINSLRFMQTARYLIKHRENVGDYELEQIDSVVNHEKLIQDYNIDSMDAFINAYREGGIKNRDIYNKVWLEQLKKDPIVYISAIANFTYLYTYPYEVQVNSIFNISEGEESFKVFKVHRNESIQSRVDILHSIYVTLSTFFLTALLYTPALYFWILIYIGLDLCFKRALYVVALSPMLIGMFICIVGLIPVNGALHYAFPMILSYPLAVSIYYKLIEEGESTLNKKDIQENYNYES